MSHQIDLNCDLGEIEGSAGELLDCQIMPFVSSVNIACGGHAGDVARIRKVVEWAINHGVAIGAHPGYADRTNFGRVIVPLSRQQIYQLIVQQIRIVADIAQNCGGCLHHVKPHGALYNLAATSRDTADAIVDAIHQFDPKCLIVGLAGSQLILAAETAGLRAVNEVFADRNYAADGTLLPRQNPHAVLHDSREIALRAASMIEKGEVASLDGTRLALACESLCLHSDTPSAVRIAEAIATELKQRGITIRAVETQG